MLKKLRLAAIFLFAVIKAEAQESFIIYNNDTERLLFKSANTVDDCLKLTMAADMDEAAFRKYYGNLANDAKQISIELDKIPQTDKKIQKLQEILHGSYLKNFNPTATFADVFNIGNYCAPHAVILYAWFLDQYHIPYELHEEPGKLFALAYPLTAKIELDGVDANVLHAPDDALAGKYVLDLVTLKYVPEDELRQLGSRRIFNDFYYPKGNLSIKTLAGFSYFNRAEVQLELSKTPQAYSDAVKAFILSGQKKCEVLQKGILLNMIPGLKFRDLRDWEAAVYALNYITISDDQKKYLNYEFAGAMEDLILKQSNLDLAEHIHNYVSANLKDTTLRNTLDEEYYTEDGRYYYTTAKYPEALQSFSKILIKNPKNLPVRQVVLDIVLRKMLSQNSGSVHNITLIDQVVKELPSLADDPAIQRIYIYNCSFLAGAAFSRSDREDGEKYLKVMCTKLQSVKADPQLDVEQTGIAFVRASEFYYDKQHNKQKALLVLNDGLKYAPNSIYITQRIKFLKSGPPTVKQSNSAYDKLKIFNQ